MTTEPAVCYAALRSGSTMLRIMLNANPGLSCLGETDFLFDHLIAQEDGTWRYDWKGLEADRIFRASVVERPAGLDGAEALRSMIGQIAAHGGGRPVLMVHRYFDRVAAQLPEAPVIRLKRDPRDVARSNIGMGWAGNTYHGLSRWLHTEQGWEAGAPLHRGPVRALRYEDLLAEPQARLEELCAYLGVAYDPAMLAYAAHSTYEAPDPRYAFQWRRKQSPEEVGLVEGRLGEKLTRYGYEPSGHPPLRPGRVDRARLWLENKTFVWRSLIGRYGAGPVLARGIGRRLGLKSLERAAQARIDAITIRYLK